MKVEVSIDKTISILYTFEVDDSLSTSEVQDLIKSRQIKPVSKAESDPEYGSPSFKFSE